MNIHQSANAFSHNKQKPETDLVYGDFIGLHLPEAFLIHRSVQASNATPDEMDGSSSIVRRRSGLHCTCTARLGLFRILIDESIEEVGECVQRKIRSGCDLG